MNRKGTKGHLLRTKLHRPPVPDDHVCRPQLIERLDQNRELPLIFVSAPAGYGKSTLVSSWLKSCECPSAWLSLDENDNDLRLFLSYFLLALKTVSPGAFPKTDALLGAAHLPSLQVIAKSLGNELDRMEQDVILVLDDFHRIRKRSVNDLISEILHHPPRPLHLVLIGRKDPFLPLASLRARKKVYELRVGDMQFSTAETAAYLRLKLKEPIEDADAAQWAQRTEGWIAGLRLAVLSVLHRGESSSTLSELHGSVQYVTEYLFNEALSIQPPVVREYLMRASLFDRFCPPLCDALRDPHTVAEREDYDGRRFIAHVMRENLFLIKLDADNHWFRFHHLFQQLLYNQLTSHNHPESITALHSRASVWFAEHGLMEEALQHALAAGDTGHAVDLIAEAGFRLMENHEWARLERWLQLLPCEAVEQSPELLILKAWIFQVQHNRLETFACLEKVEDLKANAEPEVVAKCNSIRGYHETLKAFRFYMAADGQQALTHARIAIANLSSHQKRPLVLAHTVALGSHQMLGDIEAGLRIYKEAMNEPAIKDSDYYSMFMAYLCFVYWLDADLFSFQQTAEAARLLVDKKYLPETAYFANYFRGIAHYCMNELDSAEERLGNVVHTDVIHHSMLFAHGSFALALASQAKGEPEKARTYCDAVTKHAIEISNDVILNLAHAFTAELELRQGQLAEASRWVRQFPAKPFVPPYQFYMPQLTQIRVLLAQDSMNSRQQAADLLEDVHAFLVSINNKVFLIQALALYALLHDAQGDVQAALDKLAEAVALAEPGGFIRTFMDMGPPLAGLLRKLVTRNITSHHRAYIQRILAAIKEEQQRNDTDESNHEGLRQRHLSASSLIEPLSKREVTVLGLLVKRNYNWEIAEKLHISTETVKTHLKHLYQKLNVSNRREAITKAGDLGLLEDDSAKSESLSPSH